jgi:hypothetical protein
VWYLVTASSTTPRNWDKHVMSMLSELDNETDYDFPALSCDLVTDVFCSYLCSTSPYVQ